jgi:hypothetical protein
MILGGLPACIHATGTEFTFNFSAELPLSTYPLAGRTMVSHMLDIDSIGMQEQASSGEQLAASGRRA